MSRNGFSSWSGSTRIRSSHLVCDGHKNSVRSDNGGSGISAHDDGFTSNGEVRQPCLGQSKASSKSDYIDLRVS